jgi:hypothetical protein
VHVHADIFLSTGHKKVPFWRGRAKHPKPTPKGAPFYNV